MKKRIAVVATSAAIGPEKGLNRMFYLAEMLSNHGYSVDFITSDFQHWTKSHRDVNEVKSYGAKSNVILLHECGYKKNVDPVRVYSHYMLAVRIGRYLRKHQYDLIYSDLPDNHVSAVCAKYAKRNGIPYICDVEDLWPKAMKMAFNIPIVSPLVFSYFSHDAKLTYKLATGVIGSSDTYRDDPLNYGIHIPNKATVYVGNDIALFDDGAKKYKNEIKKEKDEFWVTYAGTLGTSYDIKTLIEAADILKKKGENHIKIMILGDGPLRNEFEELAKKLSGNVVFTGYLPFPKMAGYLVNSDIVVNSVKKNAPQSIVSKIGDYLASGKPMINTCIDQEFWNKVEDDGFGLNVMPEDNQALADTILKLKNDPQKTGEMGIKARKIAEEQFDRAKAFTKIVDMIDGLLNEEG